MSSKIAIEANVFIENQTTKKNFMNFYRCVKTLNLLRNLYLSEAITKQEYTSQQKDVKERLKILKQNLAKYDLERFCQLWGIEAEFANIQTNSIGSMIMSNSEKVDKIVARVANSIPQISDSLVLGQKIEDILQSLSSFTDLAIKLKQSQNQLTPLIIQSIDQMMAVLNKIKFIDIHNKIDLNTKEELNNALTKFRMEFFKIFKF